MKEKVRFLAYNFPMSIGGLVLVLIVAVIAWYFGDYRLNFSSIGCFLGFVIGEGCKYLAKKYNWQ